MTTYGKRKGIGGPSDPRHGTTTGYRYYGCRCDVCRTANSDREREYRENVTVTEHGRRGYDLGCRCATCKTEKKSEENARLVAKREWKVKNGSVNAVSKKISLSSLA